MAKFVYDDKSLYGLLTQHEIRCDLGNQDFHKQARREYRVRIATQECCVWLHFRSTTGGAAKQPRLLLVEARSDDRVKVGGRGDVLYDDQARAVAVSAATDQGFRWTTEIRVSWKALKISSLRNATVQVTLYRPQGTDSWLNGSTTNKWQIVSPILWKRKNRK